MAQPKKLFRFSPKTLRGETIALGDPKNVTVLNRINFQHCTVSINCSAQGLVIKDCTFEDCLIGAKKAQSDQQFFTSTFERCKFVGEFWGCEFGFRNNLHGKTRGTILDCDFAQAMLDWVSFNNCDLNTLKLPRWPHFTVTTPGTTAKRIPNPRGCDEIETLRSTCLDQAPITKGITCYAPFLLEETIYTDDELRQLLSGVAGILL